MKKLFTFLAIGLVTVSFAQLDTTSGGPDAYGYSWISSDDSTGGKTPPTFAWIDITSTGTQITGYADDQGPGTMIPIGFDFPFYWYNIDEFYVGGNGYISFGDPLNVSANNPGEAFPSMPFNDIGNDYNNWVAPFMCDLNPAILGGGKIYYKTNNIDELIVSYVDVPFWGGQSTEFQGNTTFQVLFSLVDTSITFQYLSIQGSWASSYDGNPNPVVIGIESKAGQTGLMLSKLEKPNDSLAVKFTVTRNSSFSITDISLDWHNNKTNSAFFGIVGEPTWINVNVTNSGDSDVNSEIKVTTRVEKYVLGSIASVNVFEPSTSNEFSISSIAASASQEFTYSEALIVDKTLAGKPSQGTYIVSSNTTFTDGVADNNKVETELVILENKVDSLNLNYYNVPDLTKGELVGTFGFNSGGIFVSLPSFPVLLKEIHLYVSTDGNAPSDGMIVDVYKKDATGGLVGDLLYSTFVDPSLLKFPSMANDPMEVTILNGIEDNLGKPIIINDDGFYVSFRISDVSGNANYTLFEDIVKPFSFRTFEVNGGIWGEYRQASVADPMIGVVVDATNATTGIATKLSQNKVEVGNAYPNPTSGLTSIDFTLNKTENVTFTISNVIGQKVEIKHFGFLNYGKHQINFDASKLESGIYFYTIEVEGQKITKKVLIK